MTKYFRLLKIYGFTQFSHKLWIFLKRKSGIESLFSKQYAYDSRNVSKKFNFHGLYWEQVPYFSQKNLEEIEKELSKLTIAKPFQEFFRELKNDIYTLFSHHKIKIRQLDFHFDPIEKVKWPREKFWTSYSQFNPERGDIKRVWELNRLQFLDPLIPFYYTIEDKIEVEKFISNLLEQWLDQNPHNQGVAWGCSQEISIRCIKLLFVIRHIEIEATLMFKVFNMLLLASKHVSKEINYAVLQRNNHAITEGAFLLLFGTLLQNSYGSQIVIKAKRVLERALGDQFFEDGTYIQNSITYQRFALQSLLLIYPLIDGDLKNKMTTALQSSRNFLHACIFNELGNFPNYGPNDGAILFNWGMSDYRDLRSIVDLTSIAIGESQVFSSSNMNIDACMLGYRLNRNLRTSSNTYKLSFPKGGVYMIKDQKIKIMLVYGDYIGRYPSHCDSLHLDLWFKNNPILVDSGTYEYFSTGGTDFFHQFLFTPSHNTIRVNGLEQLDKGPRFTWLSNVTAELIERSKKNIVGKSYTYRGRINGNPTIQRSVEVIDSTVLIKDNVKVESNEEMFIEQFWNLNPIIEYSNKLNAFEINSNKFSIKSESKNKLKSELGTGMISWCYGEKLECIRIRNVFKGSGEIKILTEIAFNEE